MRFNLSGPFRYDIATRYRSQAGLDGQASAGDGAEASAPSAPSLPPHLLPALLLDYLLHCGYAGALRALRHSLGGAPGPGTEASDGSACGGGGRAGVATPTSGQGSRRGGRARAPARHGGNAADDEDVAGSHADESGRAPLDSPESELAWWEVGAYETIARLAQQRACAGAAAAGAAELQSVKPRLSSTPPQSEPQPAGASTPHPPLSTTGGARGGVLILGRRSRAQSDEGQLGSGTASAAGDRLQLLQSPLLPSPALPPSGTMTPMVTPGLGTPMTPGLLPSPYIMARSAGSGRRGAISPFPGGAGACAGIGSGGFAPSPVRVAPGAGGLGTGSYGSLRSFAPLRRRKAGDALGLEESEQVDGSVTRLRLGRRLRPVTGDDDDDGRDGVLRETEEADEKEEEEEEAGDGQKGGSGTEGEEDDEKAETSHPPPSKRPHVDRGDSVSASDEKPLLSFTALSPTAPPSPLGKTAAPSHDFLGSLRRTLIADARAEASRVPAAPIPSLTSLGPSLQPPSSSNAAPSSSASPLAALFAQQRPARAGRRVGTEPHEPLLRRFPARLPEEPSEAGGSGAASSTDSETGTDVAEDEGDVPETLELRSSSPSPSETAGAETEALTAESQPGPLVIPPRAFGQSPAHLHALQVAVDCITSEPTSQSIVGPLPAPDAIGAEQLALVAYGYGYGPTLARLASVSPEGPSEPAPAPPPLPRRHRYCDLLSTADVLRVKERTLATRAALRSLLLAGRFDEALGVMRSRAPRLLTYPPHASAIGVALGCAYALQSLRGGDVPGAQRIIQAEVAPFIAPKVLKTAVEIHASSGASSGEAGVQSSTPSLVARARSLVASDLAVADAGAATALLPLVRATVSLLAYRRPSSGPLSGWLRGNCGRDVAAGVVNEAVLEDACAVEASRQLALARSEGATKAASVPTDRIGSAAGAPWAPTTAPPVPTRDDSSDSDSSGPVRSLARRSAVIRRSRLRRGLSGGSAPSAEPQAHPDESLLSSISRVRAATAAALDAAEQGVAHATTLTRSASAGPVPSSARPAPSAAAAAGAGSTIAGLLGSLSNLQRMLTSPRSGLNALLGTSAGFGGPHDADDESGSDDDDDGDNDDAEAFIGGGTRSARRTTHNDAESISGGLSLAELARRSAVTNERDRALAAAVAPGRAFAELSQGDRRLLRLLGGLTANGALWAHPAAPPAREPTGGSHAEVPHGQLPLVLSRGDAEADAGTALRKPFVWRPPAAVSRGADAEARARAARVAGAVAAALSARHRGGTHGGTGSTGAPSGATARSPPSPRTLSRGRALASPPPPRGYGLHSPNGSSLASPSGSSSSAGTARGGGAAESPTGARGAAVAPHRLLQRVLSLQPQPRASRGAVAAAGASKPQASAAEGAVAAGGSAAAVAVAPFADKPGATATQLLARLLTPSSADSDLHSVAAEAEPAYIYPPSTFYGRRRLQQRHQELSADVIRREPRHRRGPAALGGDSSGGAHAVARAGIPRPLITEYLGLRMLQVPGASAEPRTGSVQEL